VWEEVFDLSAGSYDDPALRFFDLNASALVAQVDVPVGASVLDVATGTGKVALEAARAVGPRGSVIGVDVSASMLERARRKASNLPLEFKKMDATRLSFPDRSFDVVLWGHAVTFLKGDMLPALQEFHRVPQARRTGRLLKFHEQGIHSDQHDAPTPSSTAPSPEAADGKSKMDRDA
jgi:ubiquinone/menaquinone biosynthesis C-methylase UbiE